MKNILIALDYNPTAHKVAKIGFSLTNNEDANVTLLHVITDPTYYASTVYDPIMGFGGYMNMDLLSPDIMIDLKKSSYEFLEKSKHYLGDPAIRTIVKEGSVAETILEVAKEVKADTIVLGTHSKRWLEDILMGSIAEYVLHHTTVPLLIIPTKK
jgi:nucleotide-binding universal stress UspA family protein